MLPQSKISGTNIAWARAKWAELEDGTYGYIFPEEDAYQVRISPEAMEDLGISEDDLYDCIAQVESEFGAPADYRLAFGLFPNQGYSHLGITVRSRRNDRVVCVFTPTSIEDKSYDGYFEWYYDQYSGGFENMTDYLVRFDKAMDNRASKMIMSPIMPTYSEAAEKTAWVMEAGEREGFLRQVWNYHKTPSRGFKIRIEQELLPKWHKICEEYAEKADADDYRSKMRTLTASDLKQVFMDLAASLKQLDDARLEGPDVMQMQKELQCKFDWIKDELYNRARQGEV